MGRKNTVSERSAFTLLEILIVIAIISLLSGLLYPIFGAITNFVKKRNTEALFATITGALSLYSSDFSGSYPPDVMDGDPVNVRTGLRLENTSQVLCYYLESSCWTDDGARSDNYLLFNRQQKKKEGGGTNFSNVDIKEGLKGTVSEDYIIDHWGGPILYDERFSGGTRNGLNPHTFVLVSGGGKDANPAVSAEDFEDGKGVWSGVFTPEERGTIDTVIGDYDSSIPAETDTNDDLIY